VKLDTGARCVPEPKRRRRRRARRPVTPAALVDLEIRRQRQIDDAHSGHSFWWDLLVKGGV